MLLLSSSNTFSAWTWLSILVVQLVLAINITSENWNNVHSLSYKAEFVSKIKAIFSIIFYSIFGAVCLQLTQLSCDDRENVYFIL